MGPRTKIGQRRRILAKAKMEAITAQAMLARLDGAAGPDSTADLVRSGHLPQGWQNEGRNHVQFFIGGADGLNDEIRQRSQLLGLLKKMTYL